jgi:CRISPR-associated endonuclease/helicase Cas3
VIELLAKSPRGTKRLPLHRHLRDADEAAQRLFRPGSRWAAAFLRFFKLDPSEHARFLLHLRVAALFHDLGKANQSFLEAVLAPGYVAQVARHEHLSALVLSHAAVAQWLAGNPDLDQDTIIAAVLSHHLKASLSGEHQVLKDTSERRIAFYLDHPQVEQTLRDIAEVAGAEPGCLPDSAEQTYGVGDSAWNQAFDDLLELRCERLRQDPAQGPAASGLLPRREGRTHRRRLGGVRGLSRRPRPAALDRRGRPRRAARSG